MLKGKWNKWRKEATLWTGQGRSCSSSGQRTLDPSDQPFLIPVRWDLLQRERQFLMSGWPWSSMLRAHCYQESMGHPWTARGGTKSFLWVLPSSSHPPCKIVFWVHFRDKDINAQEGQLALNHTADGESHLPDPNLCSFMESKLSLGLRGGCRGWEKSIET